jgi:hypothetical protein
MTTRPHDRLYRMLPAVYRRRDVEQGEPLRALLDVIESELQVLEDDVDTLYDNWFIETCEEWVVPYIGDLLAVRGLHDERTIVVSQRARVANTLGYRRRKGTPRTLEALIEDVTGWRARVVEFIEHIATTENLNLRGRGRTIDLDLVTRPDTIGGPFDTWVHSAEVRTAGDGGRYNIRNLGIYVWRLQSHGLDRAGVTPVRRERGFPPSNGDFPATDVPGAYTVSPLGDDVTLFARGRVARGAGRAAVEADYPGPLAPGALAADLTRGDGDRELYGETSEGAGLSLAVYGSDASGNPVLVPARDVQVRALDDAWAEPPPATGVAVDVRRGRIWLGEDLRSSETPPRVTWHAGFSADVGGGSYDRRASLVPLGGDDVLVGAGAGADAAALRTAVDKWNGDVAAWNAPPTPPDEGTAPPSPPSRVVHVSDNGVHAIGPRIDLPAGGRLIIQAADGFRPVLRPDGPLVVTVIGEGTASCVLDGLFVHGRIELPGNVDLTVRHCTVAREGLLMDAATGAQGEVTIEHSIMGPLRMRGDAGRLVIRDSIVDGALAGEAAGAAIAGPAGADAPGPSTILERVTVFGPTFVRSLPLASETIFTGPVRVESRQSGCVRFSHVPPAGSQTPRRFRCQPETALAERQAREPNLTGSDLVPRFNSTRYGDPAYAQLAGRTDAAVREGAETGTEMGVFARLDAPQRLDNLRTVLEGNMPVGLVPGIFYVT